MLFRPRISIWTHPRSAFNAKSKFWRNSSLHGCWGRLQCRWHPDASTTTSNIQHFTIRDSTRCRSGPTIKDGKELSARASARTVSARSSRPTTGKPSSDSNGRPTTIWISALRYAARFSLWIGSLHNTQQFPDASNRGQSDGDRLPAGRFFSRTSNWHGPCPGNQPLRWPTISPCRSSTTST